MRHNKCVNSKWDEVTSYLYDTYEYESVIRRKEVLDEIVNIHRYHYCFVIMVVRNDDANTISWITTSEEKTNITTNRVLSVFAMKVKRIEFTMLLDYAVNNDERTEIIFDNITPYNEFIKGVIDNKKNSYEYRIVINDNNNTYINLNQHTRDYSIIDKKLKSVLSIR